jgi:hypothetical protein
MPSTWHTSSIRKNNGFTLCWLNRVALHRREEVPFAFPTEFRPLGSMAL